MNKSLVGGEMQEYVEIFNFTTWTWTVDGQIGLMFQRRLVQDPQPIPIAINYAGGGNTIAPNKFFLFASSTTIDISGAFRVADASWDQTASAAACNLAAVNNDACFPYFDSTAVTFDIIPYNDVDYPTEGAGVLTLYVKGSGIILDRVGWDGPGAVSPAFYETSPMMTGGGIKNGQVIYRKNTPPGGWDETVGPAYDSNNNNLDLQLAPAIPHFPPRNTSSAALPIKAGVPSVGAFVFANDGLSQLVQAIAAGSPPEAKFTLPNIATGTWTVNASTANYFLSFATSVMAGVTVSTSLILNTPAQYGFLSGYIKDTTNQVISNIYVNPGNGRSDLTGFYRIAAPPGFQKIFGNPNQENPNFVQTSCMVNVPLAKETGYNISLNIAGKISGWVTTDGTTPLPGISVKALNQYGGINQVASTGHDGRFELKVDSTGDYSILPAPSAGESVVPASKNVTISGGTSSVFVGTFTVSSNLGTLAGSVTAQGKPISTGVYIIASTGTVPATPPVIDHSFRQSGTVFLSGSSRSDGTYSLPVTPGTYTVAAWYTTLSGNTPTVVRKDFSNIVVSANQKTTLNIPW
ncbi:MAG: carboxypeptidase regulatory-like domain-containing protein [Elusimicrobia bacterium]|nr:carboxypeptidase regulatory-like domain-containing protein [Elusimicrobiota bacterium]